MGNIVYLNNCQNDARNLITELLNDVDDFELLIFVGCKKDGDIFVGHTGGDNVEKVGLMQVATANFMQKIWG